MPVDWLPVLRAPFKKKVLQRKAGESKSTEICVPGHPQVPCSSGAAPCAGEELSVDQLKRKGKAAQARTSGLLLQMRDVDKGP
eukprot:1157705-Pelagomonas_calceolata.AAC.3